jgi:Domain of unknown function (DUF1841)
MFNPSRLEARRFLSDVWAKYERGEPLAGLEPVVLDVILAHPEYHSLLREAERNLDRDYSPEAGETNPFLHLSLHVAIEEQLTIDQPAGIRGEYERLKRARSDAHAAKHQILECLAEALWQGQRAGSAPDADVYLSCLQRR